MSAATRELGLDVLIDRMIATDQPGLKVEYHEHRAGEYDWVGYLMEASLDEEHHVRCSPSFRARFADREAFEQAFDEGLFAIRSQIQNTTKENAS